MVDEPGRGLVTTEVVSDEPAVLLVVREGPGVAMITLALEEISLRLDALEDARAAEDVAGSTLNGDDEPAHDVFPCVGGEPGPIDELPS